MRRLLLLLAISVLWVCGAAGQHLLASIWDVVRDERGNIVTGAQVRIAEHGSDSLAELYLDIGGVQRVANPLVTDSRGIYRGYVLPGVYDVTISRAGFRTLEKEAVQYVAYAPSLDLPSDLVLAQMNLGVDMLWTPAGGAHFYSIYKRTEDHPWTLQVPFTGQYEIPQALVPGHDGISAHNPLDYAFFYDDISNRFRIIYIRCMVHEQGYAHPGSPDTTFATMRNSRFGHASSEDLVTWEHHPPIMAVDHLSENGVSGGHYLTQVWAPHVMRRGDRWYMFFTGVDRQYGRPRFQNDPGDTTVAPLWECPQRIFLVEMNTARDITNPANWEGYRYITNGLTSGTPWEDYPGLSGPTVWDPSVHWSANCRDPFVLEHDGYWYLYTTSQDTLWHSAGGHIGVSAISRAPSIEGPYTTLGYIDASPVQIGKGVGGPESVQVHYAYNIGQWYMLFVGGGDILGNSIIGWATADHPLGPWTFNGPDDTLAGYIPSGGSTPYAWYEISVPAMLPGPMGVRFDTYPSYASFNDSWIIGTTAHGTHLAARRITFHTLWVNPDDDGRLVLMRPYTTRVNRTGSVVAPFYFDMAVYPGTTYDYRVGSGFYPYYSNTDTIAVRPEAAAEWHSYWYDTEDDFLYSAINQTIPGPWGWRARWRIALNTTHSDPQMALFLDGGEWSAWQDRSYDQMAEVIHCDNGSANPCSLAVGEYTHVHWQVRRVGSWEDSGGGFDDELIWSFENDDYLTGFLFAEIASLQYTGNDSVSSEIRGMFDVVFDGPTDMARFKWAYLHDGTWYPASWDTATVYPFPVNGTEAHHQWLTGLAPGDLVADSDSIAISVTGDMVNWTQAVMDTGVYRRRAHRPSGERDPFEQVDF